ncbi:MAG: PHP domain-containing protein [Hungatella sp.]|nr:PHP domain-containing protein [Hungatella sp.]
MKADFHMHSCFSDGSETIMQIFSLAKERGLKAVAITDHDTILGMKEEEKASKKYRIPYIPAAEFTASEKGMKFHVLGYGMDPENAELLRYSNCFLEQMNERSRLQIRKMQQAGIEIEEKEFFEKAGGGPLYRAKLLGVLADHGLLRREEIMESLHSYFGKGAPFEEEDHFPYKNFYQVCAMIKEAGGNVVLAHPGKIKRKDGPLYHALLREECLDGLEVYHHDNPEAVREELLAVAGDRQLMVTGGSDYHGIYMKKPALPGAEELPEELAEGLKHLLSGYFCL